MKKYIEQRISDLEESVKNIEEKLEFLNVKETHNYDYLYNPSVNLMSHPEMETSFAGSFDSFEPIINESDVINMPPYPNIIGSWDK